MRLTAQVASVIFHPLLMPLLCTVVAFQFDWLVRGTSSPEQFTMVLVILALSTLLFPLINIVMLRWYGVLSSLQASRRVERNAPFISTFFFFALGYYMLRKAQLPESVYAIVLGCIFTLAALTLINLRWKISTHAAGVAGLAGTVLGLFEAHGYGNIHLLSACIGICGLVMTSRLYLRAHSPAQTWSGACIGFATLYLLVRSTWYL